MSITTKKVLFWIMWTLAVPVIFLFYCFTAIVGSIRHRRFPHWPMVILKLSLVKQAVYEQMVLQKKEVMEDLFSRPKNPSPRLAKNRKELLKNIKKNGR